MGTEQPPLLSSPPGRLWEQGETDLHFFAPSSASRWAAELWKVAPDRAGHDETGQLWQRDLSGRPGP